MCDIAGTIQASIRSRCDTSGYLARNNTMVSENRIMRSRYAIHLTPTNEMRRMKVNITKHRQQIVCRYFKKYKTKQICSAYYDNNIEHWLCNTDTEHSYFLRHV